jgi:hypothetical protein
VQDLHISLDAFVALVIFKTIYEPIAIRVGRWLLKQADTRWPWLPDWLHTSDK